MCLIYSAIWGSGSGAFLDSTDLAGMLLGVLAFWGRQEWISNREKIIMQYGELNIVIVSVKYYFSSKRLSHPSPKTTIPRSPRYRKHWHI